MDNPSELFFSMLDCPSGVPHWEPVIHRSSYAYHQWLPLLKLQSYGWTVSQTVLAITFGANVALQPNIRHATNTTNIDDSKVVGLH